MTPYYDDGACAIYHGDALDVLAVIDAPVDAVITDPPYASGTRKEAGKPSSGAMLRGERFARSPIDWRQWPNLVGAIETCNYRVQGMVVWDKGSMGLGNGFRAQHELICHASKGTPAVYDRSAGNVLAFKRQRPVDHPSPKPVDLMERIVRVVAPERGAVLDPFMGAGATLVAARSAGRRAVGIESNERYCEVAARRLGETFDFPAASA